MAKEISQLEFQIEQYSNTEPNYLGQLQKKTKQTNIMYVIYSQSGSKISSDTKDLKICNDGND